MRKSRFITFPLMLIVYFSTPNVAHAYLDPGTGSLLFSAVLGLISTMFFWGKLVIHKCAHYFSIITGKKINIKDRGADIVLYSEGAQYWNTFKPLVDAFSTLDTSITYWTSDQSDPGLMYKSDGLTAQYIGSSNKAFSRLNMMQAKVCISTTPGLDVLQIKRSKGVQHYAHLVHAPTTGTYKLYSFDYFDSVMCSGQHQINAIRELERKRGTPAKTLWETGCTYMDVLADQVVHTNQLNQETSELITVLVAPSWGENGLLTRFGEDLLIALLDSDFEVILRPHPNSLIVEKELLQNLRQSLDGYSNLTWDSASSGIDSLNKADIMISDFSGIVFDCAFVFEKPVITVDFDVDLNGLDANDLVDGLWELTVLDSLGKSIGQNDVPKLPETVVELLKTHASKNTKLRDESVYNYGNAGAVAANQILSLL